MKYFEQFRRHKEEAVSGILFILPVVILLGIFVFWPLGLAVIRSFSNDSGVTGFDNYNWALNNAVFTDSLLTVFVFALIITVFQIVVSFFYAHVLTRIVSRFGALLRTIIYIPYLLSPIIVGVIFFLMFNYNGGIINSVLVGWDLDPIPFLNDVFWSPVSIILPTIWIGFGYYSLVMYAGLINIPKDYYEAANLDGAKFFSRMRYITIPQMKNYFVLLMVTSVVINLQMFEIPLMLPNGQPANKTMTPILFLIHSRSNGNIEDGQIYAASILIMIIVGIVNAIVFILSNIRKREKK